MTSSSAPSAPDGYDAPADADYRHLFNLSLDLLCIAGIDGYLKQVNPSWTRVLGWSEAELLSRPVAEFMHLEDRERTLHARARLAQGIPVRNLENRYLCKDGSYRWLSWQSAIEPTATTVFAIARDITERRQLDHEQLVMSKLESTGILAAGIAHDFNNLLAGLLLNLEMVSLSGPTNPEQMECLSSSYQTIQAAKSLTDQLIAAAHGGPAIRRIMDLKPVLGRCVELAGAGHARHVTCNISADLWPAEVDEAQLSQTIRNLLINAMEATPLGGTVNLTAQNVVLSGGEGVPVSPGEYLRITVTDHGSGISAENRPKVFDPYFSTKQRGSQKGMGLGLTICRTVLNGHGGAIAIAPRPEGGTVVTCHLPAAKPS